MRRDPNIHVTGSTDAVPVCSEPVPLKYFVIYVRVILLLHHVAILVKA